MPTKRGYDSIIRLAELAELLAGEEGVGSPTLSTQRITNKCHSTILASSSSAQNIGGAANVPVYIKSIRNNRILTGILTVAGFATPVAPADLTNTIVFPIGTAIGDILTDSLARQFPDGCQLTCSVPADAPFIEVNWSEMS